jgi:hypothetical protein
MLATILRPKTFYRCLYSQHSTTGRQLQLSAPAAQQITGSQHPLQLAGDGLTGVEQLNLWRQTAGDSSCHPRVMRATERHNIDTGGGQRADKAIKQGSHFITLRAVRLDCFSQARTGLRVNFKMARMIVQQTPETRTGYRACRRHDPDSSALAKRRRRLDPRLHRHHRHRYRCPDFFGCRSGGRITGNHQRFGATLNQGLGNQDAALLEKSLRTVAIRQKTGIGEIKIVFFWQSTAQGSQNRQTTEAGVKNSDYRALQDKNRGPARCPSPSLHRAMAKLIRWLLSSTAERSVSA